MNEALTTLLHSTVLSSRGPGRFDRLRDWLAHHFGAEPGQISVKFFNDPKNYRNRLGEALRNQPMLLLAILDDASQLSVLERAIDARMQMSTATAVLVVVQTGDGWRTVQLAHGPDCDPSLVGHVSLEGIPAMPVNIRDVLGGRALSIERESIDQLLAQREHWSPEELGDALVEQFGLNPADIHNKRIRADKNLRNRIFEAVGAGARVLLIDAEDLRAKAREQVEALLGGSCVEVGFVFGSDHSRSEVVDTVLAKSLASVPEVTMNAANENDEPGTDLQFRSLKLIEELVEYLPFDAQNQKLFEEHETRDSGLHYETRALAHIRGLLADPNVSLIVLTGDAGHGKTHLCRRLLQHAGLSSEDALARICTDPAGQKPIALPESQRTVRIIKDLSEFELEGAAQLLTDLLEDENSIGIVSANEGRLRAVVSRRPGPLKVILDTLQRGLERGDTANESGQIHVINLNFQAAAPLDDQRGFLRYVLDSWTGDGRKWRSCASCKAQPRCPIVRNRELLSGRGGEHWRDGLVQLIRTAEQTSYVLTFRETLILIAYLLTGGLRCVDVKEQVLRERWADLAGRHLERLLFERRLSEQEGKQLQVLMRMRRYDPGRVAHRDVDEAIIAELEEDGALGAEAMFAGSGVPHTRTQLRQEAERFAELVRSRRRAAYFEVAAQGPAGVVERARRLGLFHYQDFDRIQGPDEDQGPMKAIIGKVIAGLHVVQGIRPPDTTDLYIVDPAFSRAGSGTAVIATRLRRKELWLRGLHEFWQDIGGGARPPLTDAVDWLDRVIVLRDRDNRALLELDLLQFEFILRAAEGVAFADFHAGERRRVLTKLARLAEAVPRRSDAIQIVIADSVCEVVVERDGSIEVPERSP